MNTLYLLLRRIICQPRRKQHYLPSAYFVSYRVFIKYCVFPWNVVIFLNSASVAAALVFDLPLCTHTDTTEGNRERPESGIYFKIFEKNTIFNEKPCRYMNAGTYIVCLHTGCPAMFVRSSHLNYNYSGAGNSHGTPRRPILGLSTGWILY